MVPPREHTIWKICLVKITTRLAAVHIFQAALLLTLGAFPSSQRRGILPHDNSGQKFAEAWQYLADGHSQQDVGQVVQRSGFRIDDDDVRIGRFGGRNRAGYGIHLQARSNSEQQFRVCCGPHCTFDDFRNQWLAEGDGGAFQDSSTALAGRIVFAGAHAIQYSLRTSALDMYSWMFDSLSAFGSLVQTPCGPRKSGIPDSVEIPAPVNATIRPDSSTHLRTISTSWLMNF